jgi:putative phage-type endonuclease
MIDLSSPIRDNQFEIKNESIIKYLNEITVDDYNEGIEYIVHILYDVIGFSENNSNDSMQTNYISMLNSIVEEILNEWENEIKDEADLLSEKSGINNDSLTISSILNHIPISYINHYLLSNFEYKSSDSESDNESTNNVVPLNMVLTKNEKLMNTTEYVHYLHNLPQKEQKSKEWLEQRQGNITASEVGTIMGITPVSWGNKNKLYTSKCGVADPLSSPALDHGNKFEEVACQIYQARANKKVLEFGMIQHQGGNGIQPIKFFGASPDGITTDGIMLEIKAPWKREMSGNITPYYFSQVQHQMECCNLPFCDFVECKLRDSTFHGGAVYSNENDYLNDCSDNTNDKESCIKTKNNLEKGIIFEVKFIDNKKVYEYPGVNLTYQEYLQKFTEFEEKYSNDMSVEMISKIYWRLEDIFMRRIPRDTSWFMRNVNTLNIFWKELKYYKNHGVDTLLKKNTKSFNNILNKPNVCLID